MRRTAIGLIGMFALFGQLLAQESSSIRVHVAGESAPFDAQHELALKFWLQQLMLSALYRDGVQESSLDAWQGNLAMPARIHARYPTATSLALPERSVLSFEEVLLPLPSNSYPEFILVKHGQRVQRLAKYDPWVLRKLVSEAKLPLYESLPGVERALF